MADGPVFAFTAPTPAGGYYPEYISVNEHDGKLVVSVRSENSSVGSAIALDKAQAERLGVAIAKWLAPAPPPYDEVEDTKYIRRGLR